jgi:hypothetical protein
MRTCDFRPKICLPRPTGGNFAEGRKARGARGPSANLKLRLPAQRVARRWETRPCAKRSTRLSNIGPREDAPTAPVRAILTAAGEQRDMARVHFAGNPHMPLRRRVTGVIPRAMARTPDYSRVNGDLRQHKNLAHAAWRSAREAQPIPAAHCDRLWCDALTAVAIAEPAIGARMLRRVETTFRLLLDMQRWPRSHEDVPPPSSPRPKMRMGPRPHWDQLARRGSK